MICTGTFLSGEIHLGASLSELVLCLSSLLWKGMKRFPAGRLGDDPSIGLSTSLNKAGFKLGRLQTGTPARLDRNTIDFTGMEKQVGDDIPVPFSFLHDAVDNAVRIYLINLHGTSNRLRITKVFATKQRRMTKHIKLSRIICILASTSKRHEKVSHTIKRLPSSPC